MSEIPQAQIDRMKDSMKLSVLISQQVALRREGASDEYSGLCPFHNEKTPSFTVNDKKGFFHCFGCNENGDHISWLMKREGLDFRAAAAQLAVYSGADLTANYESGPRPSSADASDPDDYYGWRVLCPVPEDAPDLGVGPITVWNCKQGKESKISKRGIEHIAAYRLTDGQLCGYVVRFMAQDKKLTPQITYCENKETGERRWCIAPMPRPRTFYHADQLALRPEAKIIIFGGEKKTDFAGAVLEKFICMSYCGGDNSLKYCDFSMLKGRAVIFWPDADKGGITSAIEGAKQARAAGAQVRVIEPPQLVDKGWDIGDAIAEGWDRKRILSYMQNAMIDPEQLEAKLEPAAAPPPPPPPPEERPAPPPAAYEGPETDDRYDHEPEPDHRGSTLPFQVLGYIRDKFYFIPERGGQVISMSTSSLNTLSGLMLLAEMTWWEMKFMTAGAKSFGKEHVSAAANWLVHLSYQRGIYDPHSIRGRGAWYDGENIVIHLGRKLVINGQSYGLGDFNTENIYERDIPLTELHQSPLSNNEAVELLRLCQMCSWEQSLSGYIMAGWIALAPICGILEWRPSIWLTGPSGAGKGWILKNIVRKAVGKWGIAVEAKTSATGMKGVLKTDARPFVFDEADAVNSAAIDRLQDVLFFLRVAASSDGGVQAMGNHGGMGGINVGRPTTCAAMASVNLMLKDIADESRMTVLRLVKNDDRVRFREIKTAARNLLTPEYASRLFSRTVSLHKTIIQNAAVFADAATEKFGSSRLGDQLGTLLAGAFSLTSSRVLTFDEALKWLDGKNWGDLAGPVAHNDTNERRLLSYILQYRMSMSDGHKNISVSISELISIMQGEEGPVKSELADAELRRWGIRVKADDSDVVYISNSHSQMSRLLRDTPWSTKWGSTLKGLPGAIPVQSMRFGKGKMGDTSPAVGIPSSIFNSIPEPPPPPAPELEEADPDGHYYV